MRVDHADFNSGIIFSRELLALHLGHRRTVCLPHHSRLLRRSAIQIFSLKSLKYFHEGVRRKTPHNFIFLGLFTLAEGFMLGTITATYNIDEVQYFNIRLCSTYGPRLEITNTSSVMPLIHSSRDSFCMAEGRLVKDSFCAQELFLAEKRSCWLKQHFNLGPRVVGR